MRAKEEVVEMGEVMEHRIFRYTYFRKHSVFCDDKDHGSEGRADEKIIGIKEQRNQGI